MAENFQNFYVTKLREACDASATTIYVDNPPNFSEGTLVLEFSNSTKHEIIHFTGKSGYGLTGCTRGHEGTTAQSHSAGVDVRQNVTAGILDKIINRAITTENIADNAVTTAKINDGAVTANKIDFTTMTTTNVIRIGDKKIMWGKGTRTNVPSGNDVKVTVTFPEEFDNMPIIIPVISSWVGRPYAFVSGDSVTTTTAGIILRQEHGSAQTINYMWIAIG